MSELTPAATPLPREIPLEFRATGGEYFRIWIVNLLLTILTLGIYSAWAKVRRLRYFYGSTSLDGSSFEYHGRPIPILKGRLIAFGVYVVAVILGQIHYGFSFLLAALFLFGLPWIVMRSRLFQMRMSSWRGLRFNFHGTYGGAFAAIIGWLVLAIVTVGILWPLALWKQVNYLLGNNAYGSQRFEFTATKWSFYRFCLIGLAIALGAFVAAIILFAIGGAVLAVAGGIAGGGITPQSSPEQILAIFKSPAAIVIIVLMYLAFISCMMVVAAWFNASMLNASIGGVQVGPHRVYSRLSTWPMWGILVTNLLGMIVTLGLFFPWAKVRMMRYQLTHTGVIAEGDLTGFASDGQQHVSAIGEEAADFFDIDFGF